MKIRLTLTTCARPKTKKELDEEERERREAQRRFNREMYNTFPPDHVEALLIDNKGFTRTYAVPFPPQYNLKVPVIPKMTARYMGIDTASMPDLSTMVTVVEFERSEVVYQDSGRIKQIVYRERPR